MLNGLRDVLHDDRALNRIRDLHTGGVLIASQRELPRSQVHFESRRRCPLRGQDALQHLRISRRLPRL
eukprot:10956996-Heterocapsa_arctica.AAC.1